MQKLFFFFFIISPFLLLGQSNWQLGEEKGKLASKRSDFPAALAHFQAAYLSCKEQNPSPYTDCIALLNEIGNCHLQLYRHREADSIFRLSLTLQEQSPSIENQIHAINGLGTVYFSAGQTAEAEKYYLQALAICQKGQDSTSINYGICLIYLGEVNKQKSAYSQALSYYEQATKVFARYHTTESEYPHTYRCLGDLSVEMGQLPQAEIYYQKAIAIWEKDSLAKTMVEYGTTVGEYAALFIRMGNLAKAEALAQQEMTILTGIIGDRALEMASPYSRLVQIFLRKRDYKQAAFYNQKVAQICKQHLAQNDPSYVSLMYGVAASELEMKNYAQAEVMLMNCLTGIEQTTPNTRIHYITLSNLAKVSYYLGKKNESFHFYEAALSLLKKIQNNTNIEDYMGICSQYGWMLWREGKMELAEKMLAESQATILAQSYYMQVYLSEGEMQLFWQKKCMPTLEKMEQFYAERFAENPAITQTYYNKLLHTKSILLSSIIQNKQRILASTDASLVHHYQHWQESKKQLANFMMLSPEKQEKQQTDIAQLTREVADLEKKLNQQSKAFQQISHNPQYDWKMLQSSLKKGEAAIEITRFRVYDSEKKLPTDSICYAALIIDSHCQSPYFVLLPNGKTLEKVAYPAYQKAIENNANTYTAYQAFWQPLVKELAGIKTIYIAVDGIYHSLNLPLLQDEKGNFLLDKYKLHLMYSTRELLANNVGFAEKQDLNAVLVGNPTFDLDKKKEETQNKPYTNALANAPKLQNVREGFTPLPYSEKEVNEIAQILQQKNWETAVYLRENAAEEVLSYLQSPTILHIATHGYVEETETNQNPLLHTGLYFAGAKTFVEDTTNHTYSHEDGVLSAYEAASLPLENTDLVVLSACETALGAVQPGEGVYGLQRGFKIAGAKSLLMTLWQVPDEPTQNFMKEFYQQLLSGKLAVDALKATQKKAIQQKLPLKYWGAFVLIGR